MSANAQPHRGVLPPNWQLPLIFHNRLGQKAGAQRAMFHEGHLLVILHDVPGPESDTTRHACLFWRDPEGTWRSSRGAGLVRLEQLVDAYEQHVDALEEALSRAQDASRLFDVSP